MYALKNITYIPHPSTLVIALEEVTRVSTICHCHCSYTLFEKVTYFFDTCKWMHPFPESCKLTIMIQKFSQGMASPSKSKYRYTFCFAFTKEKEWK